MTLTEPALDGRHRRSTRTRAAIVDAHLRLLERGDLRPTTTQIAAEAGISPRTFFAHFADLQALFAAATDQVNAETLARVVPPDPELPLHERTQAFLANRVAVYEYLTPFALAIRARRLLSPSLDDRSRVLTSLSLAAVHTVFARELAALAPAAREEVALALETGTTWAAWYHLTDELQLPPEAVLAVLRRTVLVLLGAA